MASDILGSGDRGSILIPFDSIPKTVAQAIYHAVTGKTENITKELSGNVVINFHDIARLHQMLRDQLHIHNNEFEPTVTVVVKHANNKAVTYSSWERFTALQVNNHEVTSEITLRLEFVIRLPHTENPQRCVVDIDIDSSLPVIQKHNDRPAAYDSFGFFYFLKRDWPTLKISIDFVDFLIAKSFSQVAEEWFSTLKKTPETTLNTRLLNALDLIRTSNGQIGRIGMSFYLAGYALFSTPWHNTLPQMTLAFALGLLIWALVVIAESLLTPKILKRISSNIIPSVIILTTEDKHVYEEVSKNINSPFNTALGILGGAILALTLNIFASYIYAYLTKTG